MPDSHTPLETLRGLPTETEWLEFKEAKNSFAVDDLGRYVSALATSRGCFFADFVAELVDGRVAVLEFKGAHLVNAPYEIEKSQVGALWAQASAGRAVLDWLTMERHGQDMAQQLDALLQ